MGLHILVCCDRGRDDRDDHPRWDSVRYNNDAEFQTLLFGYDLISHPEWDGGWFRPVDSAALRAGIREAGWQNGSRYVELLDILDGDPAVWLYFSH
jgi:hypothetical protein